MPDARKEKVMLDDKGIERILDAVLQRPMDHALDETMVQKQQLARLVKLGYNLALADAKEVFNRPGAGSLGAILSEVLDNQRVEE